MAFNVANLATTLSLNSVGFKNGIAEARTSLTAFSAISVGAFARVGSAIAAMAAQALTALPRLGVAGFHMGEQLYDASLQTGIAASQLQNLHRVAGLAGIGVDRFDEAVIKMNDSIGSARTEGGDLAKTFATLGLNAAALGKEKPEVAFLKIVDALNKLDTASSTKAYRDVFGRAGGRLRTLAEGGSQGFAAEQQRTRGLGLSLSDVEIKNIDRAKDAFADLKNIVSGFGLQLASRLAPQIESLSNAMLDFASDTRLAIEAAGWAFQQFNTLIFATGELMRKVFVGTTGPARLFGLNDRIAALQEENDRLTKEDRNGNYRSLELNLKTGEVMTNATAIKKNQETMRNMVAERDALNKAIQGEIDNPTNAAYEFFEKQMRQRGALGHRAGTLGGSSGLEPYEGGFSKILGTAAVYSGSQDAQRQAVDELRKVNTKLEAVERKLQPAMAP